MTQRWELIRDMVSFINGLGLNPHLIVHADHVSVCGVPEHVVPEDRRVVLNVSDNAVANFRVGIYQIQFLCRFGGEPANIGLAPEAVEAVFAHGQDGPKLVLPPVEVEAKKEKPTLRVVH